MGAVIRIRRQVINATLITCGRARTICCCSNAVANRFFQPASAKLYLPPGKDKPIAAQGKGAQRLPPWVNTPPTQSFFLLPSPRGEGRRKEEVHNWSGHPGRRCACLGLLSAHLSGISPATHQHEG